MLGVHSKSDFRGFVRNGLSFNDFGVGRAKILGCVDVNSGVQIVSDSLCLGKWRKKVWKGWLGGCLGIWKLDRWLIGSLDSKKDTIFGAILPVCSMIIVIKIGGFVDGVGCENKKQSDEIMK